MENLKPNRNDNSFNAPIGAWKYYRALFLGVSLIVGMIFLLALAWSGGEWIVIYLLPEILVVGYMNFVYDYVAYEHGHDVIYDTYIVYESLAFLVVIVTMMGYGLVVRKKHAFVLFMAGFILLLFSSMLVLGKIP
jgi:hypothetical protein